LAAAAVGVEGMREDQRNPVPRGTILVAEGDARPTGTAQPRVNAAPATDSDHDPATNDAVEANSAGGANASDQAGVPGGGGTRSDGGPRGGGGPGAARADEVPGPSHTTYEAADPAGPAGGDPANEAGVAAGRPERAEGAEASQPGEASEESRSGAAAGARLSGRVVEAPSGSAVAGRGPSGGAVDVPRRTPAAPAPEPSWGKVLATTISLWTTRRLRRITGGGRAGGPGPAAITGARPRRSGFRWPLVVFVLVLVILALVGLQLSGALSQPGKGQAATGSNGRGSGSASGSNSALSAAAAARSQAATWVTEQITASDMIACDALMCSTLQSDGVAASRLMTVQATTPDPLGADVVVATSAIRSQFGRSLVSEYAPQLLASFGSGASRVDVRAVAPDGAAAFIKAERADLADRQRAGAQLIRNDSLIGEKDAGEIRAGRVDSRLLITLASLLSQGPVDVGSFEVTGPGAPILYREATIVDAPGQTGTAALRAALSQVRTQPSSYQPAHAEIVHLANGQSALRIEFGAPDLPGLLSGGGNS
jgi:hypothetical protein